MSALRVWGFGGLLLMGTSAAAFEVPYLTGRIVDEAGLLDDTAEATLTERLAGLERDTGAQVAVLTVATLDQVPIEDASMQVVETWKLGRADANDGVLLLVARDDRTLRIEVGYGLEGPLPDARARRIVDHAIVPRFKEGDFAAGITAGVDEIEKAIRGEADSLPQGAVGETIDPFAAGCGFLVFLGFLSPFVYAALATRGFSGWFLLAFLSPFFFVFSIPFGEKLAPFIGLAWVVLGSIARLLWPKEWRIDPSKGGRSGSRGGGWSSSSGGGWSSGGGGGFSGGGGSFGGGGASGRW